MIRKPDQKVIRKTYQRANEKRFARIPLTVLQDGALSLSARCIYAILSVHVWQGTTAKIGQRRIADLLQIRQATVSAALKELAERGHIEVKSGKDGAKDRGLYCLLSPIFGQKQRAGVDEVISSPSGNRRLASVRTA